MPRFALKFLRLFLLSKIFIKIVSFSLFLNFSSSQKRARSARPPGMSSPVPFKRLVSFTLVGAGIGFYVQNRYERQFRDAQYDRFARFLEEQDGEKTGKRLKK